MRNVVNFLTGNLILNLAILAWAIAQVLKVFVVLFTKRKLDWHYIMASGGMPSSHSAFVCACASSVGFMYGWSSPLFSIAAVLAIVVVGAGTMNEWRTGGMLGTEQSAGNASLTAPASGASAGDAASGEIAPASKDQDQTETTAAGGADSEKTASQGGGQSGSTGTQDSRSIPGDGAQEPAATGEASQPPANNGANIYSITPDDRNIQPATANGFTADTGLSQEEALRKLAAWLGWNADELTMGADGTMAGPTGADGTTTRLICAGLNEAGTGWLCQLEQVTPGPDGTASCTTYTVPLDGSDITQP